MQCRRRARRGASDAADLNALALPTPGAGGKTALPSACFFHFFLQPTPGSFLASGSCGGEWGNVFPSVEMHDTERVFKLPREFDFECISR
jgi:hypothetical protein